MNITASTYIALHDLTVISLTGADATSFLQSQLTQDVADLNDDRAALAGYCSARGRLLASMIAVQQGAEPSDGWLLLTKADAALAFAQRLRMFVLRAKVDITISDSAVVGVRTPVPNRDIEGPGTLALPDDAEPYSVVRHGRQIAIRAPRADAAGGHRWWLLNPPADLPLSDSETDQQAWQADDIAAGLPWIQAATQEAFIPQTLNMDLIGGISFTKGCYPGQEVVARSHYRGTIKRRMAYAAGAAIDPETVGEWIGADTFDANRPGRPCGRIINAAVRGDALHVLMEVQLADLDTADFRLLSDDGPAVTVQPLPYSIQPETQS